MSPVLLFSSMGFFSTWESSQRVEKGWRRKRKKPLVKTNGFDHGADGGT